ncbi:MAG: isoprenylcysteine carboxylmethyltransferase family protein [Gemmatimonadota bacterium]
MSFHTIFVFEFTALIALRLYWHWRANTRRDRETIRAGMAREGAFKWVRLVLGIPGAVMLALYLFRPSTLSGFELELPAAVRWTGAVLFLMALLALGWVHHALGRNFNTILVLRTDHQLVTNGPYRWVRHPMYTAFIPLFIGMFLVTANVLFGVFACGMLGFLLIQRTPREEAQLRERFGPEYDTYRARTGALLPKLRV